FEIVDNAIIKVFSVVHFCNLPYQINGKAMTVFFGHKFFLIFSRIAAQSQQIVNSQKIEIDQGAFRFTLGKPTANKMRNGFHFILVLYGGTNTDGSRSSPNSYFFK